MALEGPGWGGHEQTWAVLCAGRRGCWREGTVLRQGLVERMVVSRAERAFGGLPGIPVPPPCLAQPVLPPPSCLAGG